MSFDLAQMALYVALVLLLAWPVGHYMARVFQGERTLLTPVLAPLERGLHAAAGIDPAAGQPWARYALACLAFNLAGWLLLYAILRLQHLLPLNPEGFGPLSPHLAFNTAVSFVTNTNWQSYGGETTLSNLSQMVGLTVQNFVSAATGIAVGVAVIRGFLGRQSAQVGNFWVDLVRSVLYVLLPLSLVGALILVWQGVPQTFAPFVEATTLEGATQRLAQGPVASQVAIKQLGTNGGGFFNVNSAHPYENPTPLSNLLQCLYILLIPAAFCVMFGRMAGDMRQGRAILAAMLALFLAGLAVTYVAEIQGNPLLAAAPVDQDAGNMEGKEARFGVGLSSLWAVATTAASNGSVNSMHDSYTPLGALAPLLLMMTGEVVFGGVGSGFYGMLLYVVLTVFLAGLMVGRTPEYLGKKIEAREVKLLVLTFLIMPLGILVLSAMAAVLPSAVASIQDAGPHGFSEILYAYTSATGNNGSAFAGFTANTPWHNTMLGLAMLLARYGFIVPLLAVAGFLGAKRTVPASAGTFPTHTPLFVTLLIAVILILGVLTFFPALALGPIAEHVAMLAGQTF
jgi:K+-transporting ATPase ATPase A chain